MTPHPSASDSSAPQSPGSEASDRPSPTISHPEAGESPPAEWPYRDVDPRTGRLRPISAEEWRARQEELTRRLAEIDAEDDMPEEVYDEVMRNIEASRSRPLETEASGGPSSATGHPPAGESPPAGWPYRDVDPRTGRLRPISDEELQARYEDLTRRLAEIDAEDDTPDEVFDEVFRGIDEERRRQGRPPAFEGYY